MPEICQITHDSSATRDSDSARTKPNHTSRLNIFAKFEAVKKTGKAPVWCRIWNRRPEIVRWFTSQQLANLYEHANSNLCAKTTHRLHVSSVKIMLVKNIWFDYLQIIFHLQIPQNNGVFFLWPWLPAFVFLGLTRLLIELESIEVCIRMWFLIRKWFTGWTLSTISIFSCLISNGRSFAAQTQLLQTRSKILRSF